MSDGRAAWNVVTSLNDGEAQNMGKDAHLEHDHRYDRADEFMEVVLGHWDAWEDGSLIVDKKSGRFADPAKVQRLDYKGQFFKSRGPFTVPRSSAGPSGGHSGRRLRTRQALRRAMGGGDLYRRAQCRRGQGGVRRRQERGRQGGARSGPDVPLQPHHAGLRRHQGGGRGQDGPDRRAAARDRRAVAAGGGAELRLRFQRSGRALDDEELRACRACRPSATAC